MAVLKTVKSKAAQKPAVVSKAKPPSAKAVAKPVRKDDAAAKPVAKATAKTVEKAGKARIRSSIDAKTVHMIRETLIRTRDRLTGQITALANDSLKYIDDTSSEDRTDDFDREFALNLVSSEHDAVFEIDSALRRIDDHSYGLCEVCGCALDKARLMALPFARCCVKCQSDSERGRSRFRPFGESLSQNAEAAQEPSEAEETE